VALGFASEVDGAQKSGNDVKKNYPTSKASLDYDKIPFPFHRIAMQDLTPRHVTPLQILLIGIRASAPITE
jgi:hypothetical protein